MTYEQFELPNQRRPEREWKKSLYIEHSNRLIEFVGNRVLSMRNAKAAELYRTYNCEQTDQELKATKTITQQYGYDLGVSYVVYPLAEMLVDQLVGEYLASPIRKKLYSINREAINEKLDTELNYITEELLRPVNQGLKEDLGFTPETANPEIELPDDMESFFAKNYKTNEEELGDDIIKHFLKVRKEERTIKTLLQDYLIQERAICLHDEKDGHPTLQRCKFDESYIDLNPNDEIQRDVNVFAYFPYLTKNEILNKYVLSEDQKKKIDQIFDSMIHNNLLNHPFHYGGGKDVTTYQNCKQGVSYRGWYDSTSTHRVRAMVMMWKSRKEIRAKVFENKHTGKMEYKILPADYKARKRDNIKKTSIETIRYIEMLGPEICLDYGELKERNSYIDNPKKVRLPVSALVGRNTMYSDEIRSVVAKVAPLQKLLSDILFELRLTIKANNGRVLVYDVSQIPKQFLDTYGKKGAINRMLHHIKKDKILLFNSKDKNHRATFNQFTSIDLTNRGQVKDLVDAMMLIESLGKKFVGLTDERQGESQKYQTATSIEKNIIGSNARTEVYYNPFDEFFQDILDKMLMKAKYVYKKGKVFPYVFGDLMTKFLQISGKFLNTDLGVYIGDRFKDKKAKENIDRAAIQALGNATERELIRDLIGVLNADTATESMEIFDRGLKAFEELQKENAEAAQKQLEADVAKEEAKMQHEITLQEMKDVNNIKVAQIYANQKNFTETQKRNSEEIIEAARIEADILKNEKAQLQGQKVNQE